MERNLTQLIAEALDNAVENGRRDWIFSSTENAVALDLLECDADIEKWAEDFERIGNNPIPAVEARVVMWKERN